MFCFCAAQLNFDLKLTSHAKIQPAITGRQGSCFWLCSSWSRVGHALRRPIFMLWLVKIWQVSSWNYVACVQTITKLWLVPSAKQRRDFCSGPPSDSTNYRKCVSNSPSTWLAITTNKTKAFFNWPIVARTQIWVHSWKSRTRISALFRRRS